MIQLQSAVSLDDLSPSWAWGGSTGKGARVAVIDSPSPNAFATGRSKNHAVVAVTTGLLNQLSEPELEAVLAHELTHIINRDMLVMTYDLAGFTDHVVANP